MKTWITANWLACDAALFWVDGNAAGRGFPQPLTIDAEGIGIGSWSTKEYPAEPPITIHVTGITPTMMIEDAQRILSAFVDAALKGRGQDFDRVISDKTLNDQIAATQAELAATGLRSKEALSLLNQLVTMKALRSARVDPPVADPGS